MKKLIILSFGLLIAGCAFAIMPNEVKKEKVKIERSTTLTENYVIPATEMIHGSVSSFKDCEILINDRQIKGSISIESEAFPPVIVNEGKPIKLFRKVQANPCSAK